MRKILICLLALSLALPGAALAAPIRTEDILGTWYMQVIEMEDITYAALPVGVEVRMDILPAGGATTQVAGVDTSEMTMAWKLEDNTLVVWRTDEEHEPQVYTQEGETLVTYDGDTRMIMGRDRMEALPLSPKVVATKSSEFQGDWVSARLYTGVFLRPVEAPELAVSLSIANGKVKLLAIENGEEIACSGKSSLKNGVLTADLKTEDGEKTSLTLTLLKDGTLSCPFEADGATAQILFERAVPAPEPEA